MTTILSISYSSLTSLTDSITVIDNSTVSDLGGIIDVDPLFINPQEKNFTILASSQLVNAGHPTLLIVMVLVRISVLIHILMIIQVLIGLLVKMEIM